MLLRSLHQWFVGNIVDPTIGWAAFTISRLKARPTILSHEHGDGAREQLGSRIVIFCHFDRHGRIRDHTRRYIDALQAEGFETVFVTNSSCLALSDLAWVRGRVARIVVRRNRGYDFAAWRDAMVVCGLPSLDTRFLLIANDSVYGPLHPLGPILQRIDFDIADVWGATDSWQRRFHLQSFFIAFGPKALSHEAFATFWRSVGNVRSKWWVVTRYELGMSGLFIAAGLRCKALWPYIQLIEVLRKKAMQEGASDINGDGESFPPTVRPQLPNPYDPFAEAGRQNVMHVLNLALRHVPLNPTADLWQVLIEQGCPFLKRELLRDNPARVVGVAAWSSLIGRINRSDRDVILRDLELSLKNRSP
jgi:hypothetical protein